jgi:hypothetical protein
LDSVSSTKGTFLTGDRVLANLQLEVADKAGTPKGGTDTRSKMSKILEEVPMSVAKGTTGTKRLPRKPQLFAKKLPRVQPKFVNRANQSPRLSQITTASNFFGSRQFLFFHWWTLFCLGIHPTALIQRALDLFLCKEFV